MSQWNGLMQSFVKGVLTGCFVTGFLVIAFNQYMGKVYSADAIEIVPSMHSDIKNSINHVVSFPCSEKQYQIQYSNEDHVFQNKTMKCSGVRNIYARVKRISPDIVMFERVSPNQAIKDIFVNPEDITPLELETEKSTLAIELDGDDPPIVFFMKTLEAEGVIEKSMETPMLMTEKKKQQFKKVLETIKEDKKIAESH